MLYTCQLQKNDLKASMRPVRPKIIPDIASTVYNIQMLLILRFWPENIYMFNLEFLYLLAD